MGQNSKGKILIVEDDADSLGELIEFFNACEYEACGITNGEGTVEKANAINPDLILLDVMMPAISGFETCRRLKSDENVKDIPVIFMTALSDTVNKVKGFEAGGVDYIIKPFQVEEAVSRINTHISLHKLRLEKEKNIRDLEEALAAVKQLKGMLPICMYCKKIRNDQGYWEQVEKYIVEHSDAEFTHGLCDDCCKKNFPGFIENIKP